MNTRRRICVVTGSRAEYGLLHGLLCDIREDAGLELQVVATCMHLSPEFGLTHREIEKDGFTISRKVEMLLSGDSPSAIAKSVGLGLIGFADAFADLRPDLLVVLGDRFELLSAVTAAALARIPIAHIHGGEVTEGAVDESFRHAITKMAHLHFVAAEPYRQRVIQMGEAPSRVWTVGALGLDNIQRLPLLSREALEHELNFRLIPPVFLITYHPVTLGALPSCESFTRLLRALDQFPEARFVFTKANADADGRAINRLIDAFVAGCQERAISATSLGQTRYLSALRHCDVVLGNSSSGVIEAPSFHKPTVNVGDRQKGRLRCASILDCAEDTEAIAGALRRALSPAFSESLRDLISPYGDGKACARIHATLKDYPLSELRRKVFVDLPGSS